MADRRRGQQMQAGPIRSTQGRSSRHVRFAALAGALATASVWLWARIIIDATSAGSQTNVETGLTAMAVLVALALVISLWRSPFGRTAQTMTTPALRQALATHHAGHIVAAHIEDPSRVRRVVLAEPCNRHASAVPTITQSSLRSELMVVLAGLTAEEIFAGESGSHAALDLGRATSIGADMVGRFGMAGSLVSMGTSNPRRTRFINRVLDDARTRKELESLLREVKRDTVRTMLENRHAIIAIRDALMRNGYLAAGRIREIIDSAEQARHTDDQVLVDLRIVSNRPAAGEM